MEFNIHVQVLLSVFVIAMIMGAVVNKTNFCTMGAVSDWVNMEDKGRLRAWMLAISVAMVGVLVLEAMGKIKLPGNSFPPYRTENFAWLRYLLGGVMFGVGMTLGSGCGNKTLVRIGGGNLKSLVMLALFAAPAAYLMLWGSIGDSGFYDVVFGGWINPTTVELGKYGIHSQDLGALAAGATGIKDVTVLRLVIGGLIAAGFLYFVFKSADFRGNRDNILSGVVIGAAVVLGWWITGGSIGSEWKEFADFQPKVPSRVAVQSYTFISPMGDTVRYLSDPGKFQYINFGIMALTGVIAGSLLYALITRTFRIEWFVNFKDFAAHAIGGLLMGFGGVLSMGCTIGQGVTGFSTLAVGSILTFLAIIAGSAVTMKIQYKMMGG
ncbi:MAG: hypothetical protein A2140_02625 [Candidatus Muproteobacteria bacterium RBG_16_62_13]|uniref:Uncharacterized protein n=1 Tax=Candidatus Muproteobacteria bacterium RBG_16_62_13 TaxID=1817756 RepID=A0A1F6T4B8_9PROT|nr:MAG: hypothetical protein A2140_02625 [Candidatus Muproteobacteria bacterium RBG_16_62_13]